MFRKIYSQINQKEPQLPIHVKLQSLIQTLSNNNKPFNQLQIQPENVNQILLHNYVCIEQVQSILFDSDSQLIKTMDHFNKISKNCREALIACQVMVSNLHRWVDTIFIKNKKKQDVYHFYGKSLCENCKEEIEYQKIRKAYDQLEGRTNLLNKKMILEQCQGNDYDNQEQKKFIEKHLINFSKNQYMIRSQIGKADSYIANILQQQKYKNLQTNKMSIQPLQQHKNQFSFGFIEKFIYDISISLRKILGKNYRKKMVQIVNTVEKKVIELITNQVNQIKANKQQQSQISKISKTINFKVKQIFESIFQQTKLKETLYQNKIKLLNEQIKQINKEKQILKKQKKNQQLHNIQITKQKNKINQQIDKIKLQKQSLIKYSKQRIIFDVEVQTDDIYLQLTQSQIERKKLNNNVKVQKKKKNRFTMTTNQNILKKQFQMSDFNDTYKQPQQNSKLNIQKSNFKRIQPRKASLPSKKVVNKHETLSSIRSSFKQQDDLNFNTSQLKQNDNDVERLNKTSETSLIRAKKNHGSNRVSMFNPTTITSIKQQKAEGNYQFDEENIQKQSNHQTYQTEQEKNSKLFLLNKKRSQNQFRQSKLLPIMEEHPKSIQATVKNKKIFKKTFFNHNSRLKNIVVKTEQNQKFLNNTFNNEKCNDDQNNQRLQSLYQFSQNSIPRSSKINKGKTFQKPQKLFQIPDLQLFGGFQSSFNFDKFIKKIQSIPLNETQLYILSKTYTHITELNKFKNQYQKDIYSFLMNPYQSVMMKQQLQRDLSVKQLSDRLEQIFKFHKIKCKKIPCSHICIFFDKIGLPFPQK